MARRRKEPKFQRKRKRFYSVTRTLGTKMKRNNVDIPQSFFETSRTDWVCNDYVNPGPPYRTGLTLDLVKKERIYWLDGPYYGNYTSGLKFEYDGKFVLPMDISPEPVGIPYWSYGAIGWARFVPTSPIAGAAVFLAELREAPALLIQTKAWLLNMHNLGLGKTLLRNAGHDYLAAQFGWVPMIKDLLQLFEFRVRLNKKLLQLKADNGKPVRRSGQVYEKKVSSAPYWNTTSFSPFLRPALDSPMPVVSNFVRNITKSEYHKIWFSARFRYYIPEMAFIPGTIAHANLVAKLAGIYPTVDNVYKAIPWSWLLDWFTNTGSLLRNAVNNSQYHVVADYAYVMRTSKFEYNGISSAFYRAGTFSSVSEAKPQFIACKTRFTYEFKGRSFASPYGFGVLATSFNAYQWSILLALGLTGLNRQ